MALFIIDCEITSELQLGDTIIHEVLHDSTLLEFAFREILTPPLW